MKIAMSEMNTILDKNNRSNTAKQMVSESETVAIETIQDGTCREKMVDLTPLKKTSQTQRTERGGGGDRKNI